MAEQDRSDLRNMRIAYGIYWVAAILIFLLFGGLSAGSESSGSLIVLLWLAGGLGAVYTYFKGRAMMASGSPGCNAIPYISACLVCGPVFWGYMLIAVAQNKCPACGRFIPPAVQQCTHCGEPITQS